MCQDANAESTYRQHGHKIRVLLCEANLLPGDARRRHYRPPAMEGGELCVFKRSGAVVDRVQVGQIAPAADIIIATPISSSVLPQWQPLPFGDIEVQIVAYDTTQRGKEQKKKRRGSKSMKRRTRRRRRNRTRKCTRRTHTEPANTA